MRYVDLTPNLRKQYKLKVRNPDRISVTDIWAILKGRLGPVKYYHEEVFDDLSMVRMWKGTWKHEMIQSVLDPSYVLEEKQVFPVKYDGGEFSIVGKADAYNDDHILEFKTSDDLKDEAKDWHTFQAWCYCVMFDRPVCYVSQPVVNDGNAVGYRVFGEVTRNDDWFSDTVKKLIEYHKKLMKYRK